MFHRGALVVAVALLLVGFWGCARVPRQGGFAEVRQTVAQRTGHDVVWNQDAEAQREVDHAVGRLLEGELTAEGAVQVALLNNRRLQAEFEDLGIAQANLVQAGLLKNPTLSFERRVPGQALELDVAAEFMSLLMMPMRKSVAEAQFARAQRRATQEVLELAAEVRQAFYAVQGEMQVVEMRRSVLDAAEASAAVARRLHEAGNITRLDLEKELAEADRVRLELQEAEAELAGRREKLSRAMGVWGARASWRVQGRLPEVPGIEVAGDGLEDLAVQRRLDLAAARQQIEVAARSAGITRTEALIPELKLGGHWEREADGADTVGPSIELGLPIFDQGQAAVARATALIRQSQQRYLALAAEIRSDVAGAHARMTAARARAEQYRAAVLPRRHRITQETQLQYNAMQVGVGELLAAKKAEIEAGREYIEALEKYWIARAELMRAVGGSLAGVAMTQPTTKPATRPATATAPKSGPAASPGPHDHLHHHGGM